VKENRSLSLSLSPSLSLSLSLSLSFSLSFSSPPSVVVVVNYRVDRGDSYSSARSPAELQKFISGGMHIIKTFQRALPIERALQGRRRVRNFHRIPGESLQLSATETSSHLSRHTLDGRSHPCRIRSSLLRALSSSRSEKTRTVQRFQIAPRKVAKVARVHGRGHSLRSRLNYGNNDERSARKKREPSLDGIMRDGIARV